MGVAESTPVKAWTPAAMYQFPDEYEEDVRVKIRNDAAPGLDLDRRHDSRYPDERTLEYSRPEDNPHGDGYWRRRDRQRRREHDQQRLDERAARDYNPSHNHLPRPVPGATAALARNRMQQWRGEQQQRSPRQTLPQHEQQQQRQQHRKRQAGRSGGSERLPTYEEATTEAALMATAAAASAGQLDADAGVVVPSYTAVQATGRRQQRQPPRQQQQQHPRPSLQPRGQRKPLLQFPLSASASAYSSPLPFVHSSSSLSPSSSSPTDGGSHARLTAEALRRQDKLAGHPPRPPLRRSTYSLISELRDEEDGRRARRERRLRDTQLREASLAYAKW